MYKVKFKPLYVNASCYDEARDIANEVDKQISSIENIGESLIKIRNVFNSSQH